VSIITNFSSFLNLFNFGFSFENLLQKTGKVFKIINISVVKV